MKTIHLAILMMLLAGCTQQGPQTPAPQPVPVPIVQNVTSANASANSTSTVPDCTQYCQNGTCQGSWNISGAYPDCVCGCQVPEQKNVTAPVANNTPAPEPINMTISQLLASSMQGLQSKFYSTNSGTFHVNSYTWSRVSADTDMNTISFDMAPPDDVKIDNNSLDSIVASGFIVFQAENATPQSYGVLIAKGQRTVLDDYPGSFSVDYFPPTINKSLGDCGIYEKDYYATADGEEFVSYSFICWETYDK